MADRPHVLVIGGGSVGRRHLANLRRLGCPVSVVDPRADRLEEAAAEGPLVGRYATSDDALVAAAFGAVVVASPPAYHVDQAIAALDAGLPVLLEKPVSPAVEDSRRLQAHVARASAPLLLGYTYRWWPAIRHLREVVRGGAVGRPLHVTCTMSAHLADWHPWERYQDWFMAKRELGGGALLDESHVIDLMLWFFGQPSTVSGRVDRLSSLEIDSDDNVDVTWQAPGGPIISVHLDLYGRPHDRRIVVRGEAGTAEWTFDPNAVRVGVEGWEVTTFTEERNHMFLGLASHFLEVVDGTASPACTIDDGVAVLEVVEAVRASSASGRGAEVATC